MVGPVAHGCDLARPPREFAFEKIPERLTRHVNIFALPIDEIHWHIERVFHIALKTHVSIENEGQHAGTVRVGILPDMTSERLPAVWFSLGEGGVREQRRRDRLQGHRDAEFFDHICFGTEIEVHLHRAGPEHHVEAERAFFRHVFTHNFVAAFWHPRNLFAFPFGDKSHTDHADAQIARDLFNLG